MNVRCERCRTEYEFDDAEIIDSGVTVRCTVCSHVFKVKRRSIAPLDAATLAAPQPASGPPAAREWRVRQGNGNTLTFRELTTLQRWIVERKVVRADEISLTGASWKRLGDIAELASFFEVVGAADRAAAAPADRGAALPEGATAPGQFMPGPAFAPTSPSIPSRFATALEPQGRSAPKSPELSAPEPIAVRASAAPTAAPKAVPAPAEAPFAGPETGPERGAAWEGGAPVAPAVGAAEPAWSQTPQPASGDLEAFETKAIRGSGLFKYLLVALLGLLLIGVASFFVLQQPEPVAEPDAAPPSTLPATDAPLAKIPEPAPSARPPKAAVEPRADPGVGAATGKPALAAAPKPQGRDPEPVEAKTAETQTQIAANAMAKASEPAPPSGDAEPGVAEVPQAPMPREPAAVPAPAGPPHQGTVAGAASGQPIGLEPPAGTRPFDWYVQQGLHLRARGQSQSALEMYDKAEALDAQSAEPPTGRGYCLLDQGRYETSIAQFQEALRRNGRFHDAILGLGEAYKENGDKTKAIETFKRYLEQAPDGPEASLARTTIERLGGSSESQAPLQQ